MSIFSFTFNVGEVESRWRRAVAEGRSLDLLFRIVLPDDTCKWVQMNCSAVANGADGSVRVGVLLDAFIRENQSYPTDFPSSGGLYDEDQAGWIAELRR